MRRLMQSALATASLTLLAAAGCGGDDGADSGVGGDVPTSARFLERSVHYFPNGEVRDTVRGAFDWERKYGWAIERSAGTVTRTVQIGWKCYRREGSSPWRSFRATDVDGLCEAALFGNPGKELQLVRAVARTEAAGEATIRGVKTTRYRAELDVGAVKGPIELWVDEDGVVRRSRQRGPEKRSFVSTREYFDFGVDVQVEPPKRVTA
jgi:hypothetical protein